MEFLIGKMELENDAPTALGKAALAAIQYVPGAEETEGSRPAQQDEEQKELEQQEEEEKKKLMLRKMSKMRDRNKDNTMRVLRHRLYRLLARFRVTIWLRYCRTHF